MDDAARNTSGSLYSLCDRAWRRYGADIYGFSSAGGSSSPGRVCHFALSLTVIDCLSLGVCIVTLLSLLSLSVQMTDSPWARRHGGEEGEARAAGAGEEGGEGEGEEGGRGTRRHGETNETCASSTSRNKGCMRAWQPQGHDCRRGWPAGRRGGGTDLARGRGGGRVISDCHFVVLLNHFIPGFLSYSVAVCLR